MPELPEVETVARSIKKEFLNCKILRVRVTDCRLREPVAVDYPSQIAGGVLQDVSRRGKYLLMRLRHAAASEVLFHLGMSGRMLLTTEFHPHERVRIEFDRGCLVFIDPRRFGFTRAGAHLADSLTLGPDALDISRAQLKAILTGKREIKEVLMMQNRIAGIGNIYASEILFVAGIHPLTPADAVTGQAVYRLQQAIYHVLREAIRLKGSSIADFYYGKAQQGGYQNRFKVYDREGASCITCGTKIIKIRQCGRSTWFCPQCQVR